MRRCDFPNCKKDMVGDRCEDHSEHWHETFNDFLASLIFLAGMIALAGMVL
jgi:hypothetical protein